MRHWVVLTLCAASCGGDRGTVIDHSDASASASIDSSAARKLALNHYQRLFGFAYYKDPRTDEFARYPTMTEARFSSVVFLGDAWLVRTEAYSGWNVVVRVDKQGKWVEILDVEFTPR